LSAWTVAHRHYQTEFDELTAHNSKYNFAGMRLADWMREFAKLELMLVKMLEFR